MPIIIIGYLEYLCAVRDILEFIKSVLPKVPCHVVPIAK